MPEVITRFAPSPTGDLHLGHALAAWVAYDRAVRAGGKFLLRMEDIDFSRVREEYYEKIEEDLQWLGFHWHDEVWRQGERLDVYKNVLEKLIAMGVLYPCFCTRAEIAQMAGAPHGDVPHYPQTCLRMSESQRSELIAQNKPHAWRLDAGKVQQMIGEKFFHDERFGKIQVNAAALGDVVIARKDIGPSYHLAVVVDDAAQGVTLVTRGEDLLSSTHVHRALQELLGLPEPAYFHHRLVCDESGKRLAKRNDALSIRSMRASGMSAAEVMLRFS